jgi:Anticodon-binding domain
MLDAITHKFICLTGLYSVRIATHPSPNTPSSLDGILFAYDSNLRLAAITSAQKISASQSSDYRFLPLSAIKTVTPLGGELFDDDINALVSNTRVDPETLNKREENAIHSLKMKESTRNREATKEGQAIFDFFSRQYVSSQ